MSKNEDKRFTFKNQLDCDFIHEYAKLEKEVAKPGAPVAPKFKNHIQSNYIQQILNDMAEKGLTSSLTPGADHQPIYEELSLSQLEKRIGKRSANAVRGKGLFVTEKKEFRPHALITSAELHSNYLERMDEISQFVDETTLSRLTTDPEKFQLNLGMVAPSGWLGRPNPMHSQLLTEIMSSIMIAWLNGASKVIGDENTHHMVGLNKAATTGICTTSSDSEFNAAYDSETKLRFIQKIIETPEFQPIFSDPAGLTGYRGQDDTMEKRPKRGSVHFVGTKFSNKVEHGTVTDVGGMRGRLFAAVPWALNVRGVALNKYMMSAVHDDEWLSLMLYFTHDLINDALQGTYEYCTDVSNNDVYQPTSAQEYINRVIAGPYAESLFTKFVKEAPIYGAYPDSENELRYYKFQTPFKQLLSGIWSTSLTNKIYNTALQIRRHMFAYLKISGYNILGATENVDRMTLSEAVSHLDFEELKNWVPLDGRTEFYQRDEDPDVNKFLSTVAYYLFNNGDDTVDYSINPEWPNLFADVIENHEIYAEVGYEPPSFSGMKHRVDDKGKFLNVYAALDSMFRKSLVGTERRDYDGPNRTLTYNSLLGRAMNPLNAPMFPGEYEEINKAITLFLELNNFYGSILELEELAKREMDEFIENDPDQREIQILLDKLNETDFSKLFYKYTLEEMAEAHKPGVEVLFIHVETPSLLPSLKGFYDSLSDEFKMDS